MRAIPFTAFKLPVSLPSPSHLHVGPLALLWLVLAASSSLAQVVPSPEQRRDLAISDMLRGCAHEAVVLHSHLTRVWTSGTPDELLANTLAQITVSYDRANPVEHLNVLQGRIAYWHSSRNVVSGRAPGTEYNLLEICALQRRIEAERAPGFVAPVTSTRVYRPAQFPGGLGIRDPQVARLDECLDIEAVEPLQVRATNRCAEPVTVSWCIEEYVCGRVYSFATLRQGASENIGGLRRGVSNTIYTWLCPGDKSGNINPAHGMARCPN